MPNLLIPAYFYPDSASQDWIRLFKLSETLGKQLTVILNPNSGPGEGPNPDYQRVMEQLQSHGSKTIGYVHTCWGLGKDCDGWKCKNDWIEYGINRMLPEIKAEVSEWLQFYPSLIDGFFFDEVSVDKDKAHFYTDLQKYCSTQLDDPMCIFNYGMPADPVYYEIPNSIHCILEQRFQARPKEHWKGYEKWTKPYTTNEVNEAILLHATAPENWKTAFNKLKKEKVSYIYITDAMGANPWDRLPTYCEDLATVLLKKSNWLKKWF